MLFNEPASGFRHVQVASLETSGLLCRALSGSSTWRLAAPTYSASLGSTAGVNAAAWSTGCFQPLNTLACMRWVAVLNLKSRTHIYYCVSCAHLSSGVQAACTYKMQAKRWDLDQFLSWRAPAGWVLIKDCQGFATHLGSSDSDWGLYLGSCRWAEPVMFQSEYCQIPTLGEHHITFQVDQRC